MINYIVDDMDALPDRLKQEGVKNDAKRMDESYGCFAWIYNLDGNKIELRRPLPAKLERIGGDDETRTRDLCRDRAAF